ncbi:hypothetical protein EDD21DRAFT_416099 [Dissophora ornata]|nr:hypothetical protein BGZ58_010330 [Dissophora ornata]KAI8600172.1 hypothetical protein EDD21DRAFT_416099 [Dissophora ornata]
MCLLLWTLPQNDHPRIKFAFASNRDECLDRPTAYANFWDTPKPLPDTQNSNGDDDNNSSDTDTGNERHPGILCGVDCKPPKANLRSDQDLPGTWVGITTEGDLVALTDYLEPPSYYDRKTPTPPKPSRGQLCGDFLVAMTQCGSGKEHGAAEQWIRRHAEAWDTTMEGLNLLVVQGAGEQQCVGANREGSQLLVLHSGTHHSPCSDQSMWTRLSSKWNRLIHPAENDHIPRIAHNAVAGLSNSVYSRPWRRVEIGMHALEGLLNKSLERFGLGQRASLQSSGSATTSADSDTVPAAPTHNDPPTDDKIVSLDDDSKEFAWLVIEMLTLLRINTKPYPPNIHSFDKFTAGIRDRVFVPRTGLEHLSLPHLKGEYGTRSSTVVLFGRDGRAVFVEKNWYTPRSPTTGERREYEADSPEGVIWWQGQIGQPREEWVQIQGPELEVLFKSVRDAVPC